MPIRLSGMVSGLDTEALVQDLVSSYNTKKESYEKEQTRQEWKMEKWKELNSKIYKFYTGTLNTMKMASNYNKKKTEASDSTKASVVAATNAVTGTQSLIIGQLAASGYLTGAKINAADGSNIKADSKLTDINADLDGKTISINGTDITIDSEMKVSDLVKKLRDAGVNASFDENNQRFFVSAKESGVAADFTLGGDSDALSALGLTEDSGAVRLDGKDAIISLNGATFTSKSNTFSINGLTIEAKELSEGASIVDGKVVGGSAVTLSTTTDVDGVYDMVKGFIKEYNALIKELETVYNAEAAKGYEPLTSEEKEAMSEDDVEKWESKIKDSLLRRDNTVSSIVSTLKNAMASSYEVDGTKFSLSSFGINTLSYFTAGENEKGLYHIDGDADDSSTSGNDDKLKAMIATDPDAVTGFFRQLGQTLNDKIYDKMKSTTLSSSFTVYNDKQMDDELDDIKDKITKWEDYVAEQEDYWYAKFAAMEKALSELQSSTSALSGLLGTA